VILATILASLWERTGTYGPVPGKLVTRSSPFGRAVRLRRIKQRDLSSGFACHEPRGEVLNRNCEAVNVARAERTEKRRTLEDLFHAVQQGKLWEEALAGIKGIGPWTLSVLRIMVLREPDVLPLGDAGLERAIANVYGKRCSVERLGEKWCPWCSVAGVHDLTIQRILRDSNVATTRKSYIKIREDNVTAGMATLEAELRRTETVQLESESQKAERAN
jgi:hypothetical protein